MLCDFYFFACTVFTVEFVDFASSEVHFGTKYTGTHRIYLATDWELVSPQTLPFYRDAALCQAGFGALRS